MPHIEKITAKMRKENRGLRECSWFKRGELPCFERATHVIDGDAYCAHHIEVLMVSTEKKETPCP